MALADELMGELDLKLKNNYPAGRKGPSNLKGAGFGRPPP
jgi:hypothetical protein